jgi:hypothetical protein
VTPVDRLIDDVARRMTAAAATRDLPARTLEIISRHRRTRPWWRLAPPAAIAAVLIAVLMARGGPIPGHSPAGLTSPGQTVTRADVHLAAPPAAAAPAPRPRATRPAISAAEAIWQARRLPALPAPDPIETDDLQPETLGVPLLELKPLATEPIALASMPGGR